MKKKLEVEKRVKLVSNYIIENQATIRDTAKEFGYSKSTIHKDISERLPKISSELFKKVQDVINLNVEERHMRGGLANQKRWEEKQFKEVIH